jgi:putative inorganic carbon (HCO3(-)) transporter
MYGRFIGHDGGSAESRIPQFEVAFNIIKDKPFLGVGINNYSEVMHRYDNTEEGLASITKFPVHNIYLHIAAEMGLFGLFIFIWILAVIFTKGVSYIMQNNDIMVYVVIGMLAGILAFLIHGLFDVASIGSKMFLFMWFFAGIIIAAKNIKPE